MARQVKQVAALASVGQERVIQRVEYPLPLALALPVPIPGQKRRFVVVATTREAIEQCLQLLGLEGRDVTIEGLSMRVGARVLLALQHTNVPASVSVECLQSLSGTRDALPGKPLQHIANFRVQARAHQRIKWPAGLHTLLDICTQAVLSLRPIPGVDMLLVLGHQCGGRQLGQQRVRLGQHMPGALAVRVVQHRVDLRGHLRQQSTCNLRRGFDQEADRVEGLVQRRVLAMREARRQLPGLAAEFARRRYQTMGHRDPAQLQRRLQMHAGLLTYLRIELLALGAHECRSGLIGHLCQQPRGVLLAERRRVEPLERPYSSERRLRQICLDGMA